jgi:hypothetical protein
MGFLNFFKNIGNNFEKNKELLNLELNDTIEYELSAYQVTGRIIYNDGNSKYYNYRLANKKKVCWLYIEGTDNLKLSLFQKLAPKHQLYNKFLHQPPQTVIYNQQIFNLIEQGRANIKANGQVEIKTGQTVKYYQYQADNNLIFVQKQNGELEISLGIIIDQNLIKTSQSK